MSASEVDLIARVVHEAIRAYQTALGEEAIAPWDEAEPWQRKTTIAGVKFRLAHPEATGEALHDLWAEELRGLGWSHGKVKDPDAKTHPSLVPYKDLSVTDRRKDELFGAVVSAFAGSLQGEGAATRKPR